jgi:chitosanase
MNDRPDASDIAFRSFRVRRIGSTVVSLLDIAFRSFRTRRIRKTMIGLLALLPTMVIAQTADAKAVRSNRRINHAIRVATANVTVPTVPAVPRESGVPTVPTVPREQTVPTVPTVPKREAKPPAKKKKKPSVTTSLPRKRGKKSATSTTLPPTTVPGSSTPKVSVVSSETTVSDTKPSDTKPSDAKPTDTKPGDTKPPTAAASSKSKKKLWLIGIQRKRADQLISVFENSTVELQYDYAENLDDGRGLTLGRAGFTTGTCDALEVVRRYSAAKGTISFARFADELHRLCDDNSGDTDQLPEEEFVSVWKQAAKDPLFKKAQDATVDDLYYSPAMEIADRLGLKTVLARVALYDTAIQHGVGDDADGLPAIIKRTNERAKKDKLLGKKDSITTGSESAWLTIFLATRSDDLRNPSNQATATAWAQSVDRVTCLQSLLNEKKVTLKSPFACSVYGTTFTIS